ncbi:MAG TPA: TraR/DksA family transcriptional regulator [Burkholderiaceae bacterium]|nr:TraR/DksA family transcriptional regulator [Burkholderiaceae bacterium]
MTTSNNYYDSIKTQLLAQLAESKTQLANLRGGNVSRAEASAAHFGNTEDSTAQVNTARDLEFAMDAHETDEQNQIMAALNRIQAGTYGQCVDCGVQIPLARLQANPSAMRCISCQEKAE